MNLFSRYFSVLLCSTLALSSFAIYPENASSSPIASCQIAINKRLTKSQKLALAPAPRTFYVSPSGLDTNNGLSKDTPFRTLQKAGNAVSIPGDTVYIMNGEYVPQDPSRASLIIFKKNGSALAPITFKAYPGHRPVIRSRSAYTVIVTASSYIVIDGLTLIGASDSITLEYALSQKSNFRNPLTINSGFAVAFANDSGVLTRSHHITISNNKISKFSGGGIITTQADYINIENNIISETTMYSPLGANPISALHNWNYDNNTNCYRYYIVGNVTFNNRSYVPWANRPVITEGHGIIIDSALNLSPDSTGVPYTGKTFVANNISYNNGGSGIVALKSPNVDIVNNTTYQNGQSPELAATAGEISSIGSRNVRIFNNIMYASPNALVVNRANSTNLITGNNLVFNSTKYGTPGVGDIFGKDPKFANIASRDFRLQPTSPAIDAGASRFNGASAPKIDALKLPRPIDGDRNGKAIADIGAYEYKPQP